MMKKENINNIINYDLKKANQHILKISMIISIIVTSFMICFFCGLSNITYSIDKTNDIIRYHIIGKSDDAYDQKMKMKLKEISIDIIEEISKDSKGFSKSEYEIFLKNNLDNIINSIYDKINTCDDEELKTYMQKEENLLKISLEECEYPLKSYDDKIDSYVIEQGVYTSLKIQIGKAQGHNFWQILYPSMNITEECYEKNQSKEDIKLEFKLLKLFD